MKKKSQPPKSGQIDSYNDEDIVIESMTISLNPLSRVK